MPASSSSSFHVNANGIDVRQPATLPMAQWQGTVGNSADSAYRIVEDSKRSFPIAVLEDKQANVQLLPKVHDCSDFQHLFHPVDPTQSFMSDCLEEEPLPYGCTRPAGRRLTGGLHTATAGKDASFFVHCLTVAGKPISSTHAAPEVSLCAYTLAKSGHSPVTSPLTPYA